MKNFQSRISKIENELQKGEKQRSMNIRAIWKKVDPNDLKKIQNTVKTFRKKFGYKCYPDDFATVLEDSSHEERCNIVFSSFSRIIGRLIMAMHYASLGVQEEKKFIEKVQKDSSLSIAFKSAEESFAKIAED